MLLDNKYTIVPSIRFTLTYDNGIRKVITVNTRDTIDCSYKKNGEKFQIVGDVSKIGCNFNSSLGAVGTTAYLQVDGSSEYSGQVEYIQPSQVLDLTIISSSGIVDNVVCSVDNEDQKITLIRENEVGVFQYSLDGITWRAANGAQGMSAYECAVALGFEGTEEEWLESLKGEPGCPGEPGALEIYKVFNSFGEAERNRDLVPKGKLVAVVLEKNTVLLVRNHNDDPCPCKCCKEDNVEETVHVRGYKFVGYLTVGPQGEPGKPGKDGNDGKSAYDYAVEGGFPGTEKEFMDILGRCTVAVTNFYMGPTNRTLTNTVIGPIDLRIFGYTNPETFKPKKITRINISCPSEEEDQTLLFREPVILRAVPTLKESAKPNIIIRGQKYVADCIMNKNGEIGVMRRIRHLDSYNGETILGDWISSTGQLDMGAKVDFVSYGRFEPFPEEVQSQYRKLHTYDNETKIETVDGTYMSVSYPINVTNYIDERVSTKVEEYLAEKGPEIIVPIVEEKMRNKQDKLVPGDHIVIDSDNKISVKDIGALPEGKTVVEYIGEENGRLDAKITSNTNRINNLDNTKQDKLTAGENIVIEDGVISSTASGTFESAFKTTKAVGGIAAGTDIPVGMSFEQLLHDMLAPYVPPEEYKVYTGVSDSEPMTLEGFTGTAIEESKLIAEGYQTRYTANNQLFVFAYPKSTGELISIKDPSGFEQLDGWNRKELTINGKTFYVYYTKETLTVTSFKITFIFTD